MSKTVYQWSLEFYKMGIATFPVHYRNKHPKVKWEQYQKILPEQNQLKRWFEGGSLHNYGVVAGWNNLVILDFDSMDRYHEWQMWSLSQTNQSIKLATELAFQVKTARGIHIYLQMNTVFNNSHIEGLDIKAHGYVLGPGSIHPSGVMYTAKDDTVIIPNVGSLEAVLPAEWIDELQHPEEPEICGLPLHTEYESDPFDAASNPLIEGEDLIKQIRERYKLQDFVHGCVQTGRGWFMGICPFHDDNSPSFWIDDRRQIGNCQACHFPKPFDVINLYAAMKQLTTQDAIKQLARL
jgi:hypothetical protein